MDQSQSSQTEEKSRNESSLLERIPEISQLSLRPGRQISSSSSIINSNSIDASQFVKENVEQIKTDPFVLISDETTRQTLFKMIYILEQQNADLISKFEANKPYIIKEENIENKYALQSARKDQRQAIIKELKNRNARHVGQVKLLEMYRDQKQRLMKEINDKNKIIDQLIIEKNEKQVKCRQLDNQLKESSDKLLKLKQKKNRIYDDIHRKKNNEKMADSGVIDRLLGEYYETIKEVMDDDQSVERINKNTKMALSQIGKGKAGGFTSFLEGIESNKMK